MVLKPSESTVLEYMCYDECQGPWDLVRELRSLQTCFVLYDTVFNTIRSIPLFPSPPPPRRLIDPGKPKKNADVESGACIRALSS